MTQKVGKVKDVMKKQIGEPLLNVTEIFLLTFDIKVFEQILKSEMLAKIKIKICMNFYL